MSDPSAAAPTAPTAPTPTYHALLIGIDAYAPPNTLYGCVNDILAIEALLLDPPGIGVAPEHLQVTRLIAPNPGTTAPARPQVQAGFPSRAAILQALQALAGPNVGANDRVLIYYSGHGDQKRWTISQEWHEALVPQDLQFLYDVEVNALIEAIAARTDDLTVILDCCHSAGAFRALEINPPDFRQRFLGSGSDPVEPPAGLPASRGLPGAHLLQGTDPRYLVLAACQADERAGERSFGARHQGLLTYGLMNVLRGRAEPDREAVRWADLWPDLLAAVAGASAGPPALPVQNPWLVGRPERHVFGGPWSPQDTGFRVTRSPDGTYTVGAGSVVGVTAGAQLAVYGAEPALFPPVGSPADLQARAGVLTVTRAGRAESTAQAVGAAFALPEGARARLIQPGAAQALQVGVARDDPAAAVLGDSPLLAVIMPDAPGVDVTVTALPGGGWNIGNLVEAHVATVPAGAAAALRVGLEAYARYNQVLRLARTAADPPLSGALAVRLLDAHNAAAIGSAAPAAVDRLLDALPEAPRDANGYALPKGFPFAVQVSNAYRSPAGGPDTLYVTLLNCTAGGKVEYAGDVSVRSGARENRLAGRAAGPGVRRLARHGPALGD